MERPSRCAAAIATVAAAAKKAETAADAAEEAAAAAASEAVQRSVERQRSAAKLKGLQFYREHAKQNLR